jgi:hypothetical protein
MTEALRLAAERPPTVSVSSGEPLIDIEARFPLLSRYSDMTTLKTSWEDLVTTIVNQAEQGIFEESLRRPLEKYANYVNAHYDRKDPYIEEVMSQFFSGECLAKAPKDLTQFFIRHPALAFTCWTMSTPIIINQALQRDLTWFANLVVVFVYNLQEDAAVGYDIGTLLKKTLLSTNPACLQLLVDMCKRKSNQLLEIQTLMSKLRKNPNYSGGILRWDLLWNKPNPEQNNCFISGLYYKVVRR